VDLVERGSGEVGPRGGHAATSRRIGSPGAWWTRWQ
jgi:hypothetical protein